MTDKSYSELCKEECDYPDICFKVTSGAYYQCKKHNPINEDGILK